MIKTQATDKIFSLRKRIRSCGVLECWNEHHAKGYCTKHYQRYNKFGDAYQVKAIIRGGFHSHPLKDVYYNMMARCNNPKNNHFKYYGLRGIKVCKRWDCENGFINFVNDMGNRPPNTSLDRIDVNGDYEPSNCRWTDKYTQAANVQRKLIYPGISWFKLRKKYRARIKINGKEIHLGLFNTIAEAVKARKEAEVKYL